MHRWNLCRQIRQGADAKGEIYSLQPKQIRRHRTAKFYRPRLDRDVLKPNPMRPVFTNATLAPQRSTIPTKAKARANVALASLSLVRLCLKHSQHRSQPNSGFEL
jgi:hypothetical protein